jgi:DNA-binding response OmpR family regulator
MVPRILIVDDEPNIVLSLEFLLRREGWEPAVAADGEAALAELERAVPDLVLLDVMLPRLNGLEVLRRIRADARWGAVRVIVLTAKSRDTEVTRGMELGADAYVTKPFSTRELVELIRRLLPARA